MNKTQKTTNIIKLIFVIALSIFVDVFIFKTLIMIEYEEWLLKLWWMSNPDFNFFVFVFLFLIRVFSLIGLFMIVFCLVPITISHVLGFKTPTKK